MATEVYGTCDLLPEGKPCRLDLRHDGRYTLTLVGAAKTETGTYTREGNELTMKPAVVHDIIAVTSPTSAVITEAGAEIDGVVLPKVDPSTLSSSILKASEAVKVAGQAMEKMKLCERKVHEEIHNATYNYGSKPRLIFAPPPGFRAMAQKNGRVDIILSNVMDTHEATSALFSDEERRVRGFDFCGEPITHKDLRVLCSLLRQNPVNLTYLDISSSLNVKGRPIYPKEEVDREAEALAQQFGPIPEEDEENPALEKLREAVAAAGGEFTTVEAGFRVLARQKLCRGAMLIEALRDNKTLKHLNLASNTLGVSDDGKKNFKQLRMLKASLDDHPKISTLNLSDNELGPKGTGVVVKGMIQNVVVTDLDLSGNAIGEEEEDENDEDAENDDPAFGEPLSGPESIADLLKKNKFITTLRLCRNDLKCPVELETAPPGDDEEEGAMPDTLGDDTPFYKMVNPLTSFNRLQSLDLSGNEIGPGGAFVIGAVLKKNKSVTSIDLSENGLGPQGVEVLCNHLHASNSLKRLALRRNGFAGLKGRKNQAATAKCIAAMCTYLSGDQNRLEHLDLAYNHLGPDHGAAVLEALTGKPIISLDVSLNQLAGTSTGNYVDTAVAKLVRLLEHCPMEVLRCKWNFLQHQGGEAIAKALVGAKHLRVLDLERNFLEGGGVAAVCSEAGNLHTLRLGDNNAGPAVARAVSDLLNHSTALRLLNLSGNKLGTEAACTVLRAVNSSRLAGLDISRNKIGADAAAFVGEACCVLPTLLAGDNDFGTEALLKHVIPALRKAEQLRTLSVWGGAGSPIEVFVEAASVLRDGGAPALLELDLGVPKDISIPDTVAHTIQEKLLEHLLECTAECEKVVREV